MVNNRKLMRNFFFEKKVVFKKWKKKCLCMLMLKFCLLVWLFFKIVYGC